MHQIYVTIASTFGGQTRAVFCAFFVKCLDGFCLSKVVEKMIKCLNFLIFFFVYFVFDFFLKFNSSY